MDIFALGAGGTRPGTMPTPACTFLPLSSLILKAFLTRVCNYFFLALYEMFLLYMMFFNPYLKCFIISLVSLPLVPEDLVPGAVLIHLWTLLLIINDY